MSGLVKTFTQSSVPGAYLRGDQARARPAGDEVVVSDRPLIME